MTLQIQPETLSRIEAAEAVVRALQDEIRRSPDPDPDIVRREEEAWDAYTDLKADAGVCFQVGCRTPSERAYCGEHRN